MAANGERQRSSTAFRHLSELFRRGSQSVEPRIANAADGKKTESADSAKVYDYDAILKGLFAKSDELSSLSGEGMVRLAEDLLSAIRGRSGEWSTSGDWVAKELRLLRLLPDGEERTFDGEADSCVRSIASMIRFQMGSFPDNFISSYIDGMRYEADGDDGGEEAKKGAAPELLRKVEKYRRKDGKVVNVHGPIDFGAMLPGHTFEVWTNPREAESGSDSAAVESIKESGVAVVLGAGNQSFLTLTDVLQQCLVHRRIVLIKHHPLRPFLMEPFSIILEPLIRRGFLRQVVDRGIPTTTEILSNPLVKHVHLTGSLATDRAVKETLKRSRPDITKSEVEGMVTSELGCATPFVISKGTYSDAELKNAAQIIAAGKKAGGGCNCLSSQVVVLPKGWSQGAAFRKELVEALETCPTSPAYYPGSIERKNGFIEHYKKLGEGRATVIKGSVSMGCCSGEDDVVLIDCGVFGEDGYDGEALKREAFGPVLAVVELPGGGDSVESYLLDTAIPFVNDKNNLYGSLSCSLFSPESQDLAVVKQAVSSLNYGCVGVNTWTCTGYFVGMKGGVWGAYSLDSTGQSGSGHVGNAYGIKDVGKSVVRGPPLTKPPIFDVKPPPPAIVFDALHALTCANSTVAGIVQLVKVLVIRTFNTFISPLVGFLPTAFLPTVVSGTVKVPTYPYGSAL